MAASRPSNCLLLYVIWPTIAPSAAPCRRTHSITSSGLEDQRTRGPGVWRTRGLGVWGSGGLNYSMSLSLGLNGPRERERPSLSVTCRVRDSWLATGSGLGGGMASPSEGVWPPHPRGCGLPSEGPWPPSMVGVASL